MPVNIFKFWVNSHLEDILYEGFEVEQYGLHTRGMIRVVGSVAWTPAYWPTELGPSAFTLEKNSRR